MTTKKLSALYRTKMKHHPTKVLVSNLPPEIENAIEVPVDISKPDQNRKAASTPTNIKRPKIYQPTESPKSKMYKLNTKKQSESGSHSCFKATCYQYCRIHGFWYASQWLIASLKSRKTYWLAIENCRGRRHWMVQDFKLSSSWYNPDGASFTVSRHKYFPRNYFCSGRLHIN